MTVDTTTMKPTSFFLYPILFLYYYPKSVIKLSYQLPLKNT